jgi:hypothetical protein
MLSWAGVMLASGGRFDRSLRLPADTSRLQLLVSG